MQENVENIAKPQPPSNHADDAQSGNKPPFQAPRLRFIKPKLTREGGLTEVTAGFFGTFSP